MRSCPLLYSACRVIHGRNAVFAGSLNLELCMSSMSPYRTNRVARALSCLPTSSATTSGPYGLRVMSIVQWLRILLATSRLSAFHTQILPSILATVTYASPPSAALSSPGQSGSELEDPPTFLERVDGTRRRNRSLHSFALSQPRRGDVRGRRPTSSMLLSCLDP